MRRQLSRCFSMVGMVFLLVACSQTPGAATAVPTAAITGDTAVSHSTIPTLIPTLPQPTATPTFTPSPTAIPTTTPTSTATYTPTPVPTPTHPLMIEVMRQQTYPGSALTFEQTLEPGDNYSRYLVSYQSEGNKIYALLTVPWGTPPDSGWPVIIFNHGYVPPDEYRTTERYVDYVDYIARNRYIVFRSDYRGHGNSEGEANGGYRTPDYTIDVLNGLAAVKIYAEADPHRIGMWGHSMGGYITLRAMVINDEIKAGVIWAGVVGEYPNLFVRQPSEDSDDPAGTPTPTRPRPRGRSRWWQEIIAIYGPPEENPVFWASISANTYLQDLGGPLQLHHGTGDTTVPVAASEQLQRQMETAGIFSELYLYEGDNHNISANFYAAMGRTVEFFDRYVKGPVDG